MLKSLLLALFLGLFFITSANAYTSITATDGKTYCIGDADTSDVSGGCYRTTSFDSSWHYVWQSNKVSKTYPGSTMGSCGTGYVNIYFIDEAPVVDPSLCTCQHQYEWQPTDSLSIINNGAEAVLAGYACFETACSQEFVDYTLCQNDPTLNHPVFSNHQWDQDYEDGIDCGGVTGYSCDYACASGDDLTTDMVTGKQLCISYSSANPAGVCPDGFSRVEGSNDCTFRYDARGYDPEFPSNYPDFTDIPSDTPAPIDNTQESSETTVESETTTNPDGSVTQKTTEKTKATDASGTTTDTTKTTETTTKPDGTKTEQVRTETKITSSTGADGKTTTKTTTNVYAADGTLLSSTSNTSTAASSNASGTGSPTRPTAMNVSLDLGPVTERIDKSNETLDEIKDALTIEDPDSNAPIEKFNSTVETAIEDSQAELHDYMKGMEKPGFGDLPFNESINSEIGNFVPGGKTCTDLVFPYEFLGQSRTFVIECDNFEKYMKPILTWVFYCFTAVMVYYSFTAPVGEN